MSLVVFFSFFILDILAKARVFEIKFAFRLLERNIQRCEISENQIASIRCLAEVTIAGQAPLLKLR